MWSIWMSELKSVHQKMHFAWRTSDAQRQAIVADIASHFEFVRQEGRPWRVATPE
jgi:hypothetical protein